MSDAKEEVRVLVADDSASFRMFIQKVILEIWPGAVLTLVRDGMEVIEYFEDDSSLPPNLVLLDIGETSFDVLKWLREQKRQAQLPIVIWSSTPSRSEEDMARKFRATDYLKKPDTFEELLTAVRLMGERYIPNSS